MDMPVGDGYIRYILKIEDRQKKQRRDLDEQVPPQEQTDNDFCVMNTRAIAPNTINSNHGHGY